MKRTKLIFATAAFIMLGLTFYALFNINADFTDLYYSLTTISLIVSTCVFCMLAIKDYDNDIYTLVLTDHEGDYEVTIGPICKNIDEFRNKKLETSLKDDGASHYLYRCNKSTANTVLSYKNMDRVDVFMQGIQLDRIVSEC